MQYDNYFYYIIHFSHFCTYIPFFFLSVRIRRQVHAFLNITLDRPYFRRANSLIFIPSNHITCPLMNVHLGLKPSGSKFYHVLIISSIQLIYSNIAMPFTFCFFIYLLLLTVVSFLVLINVNLND